MARPRNTITYLDDTDNMMLIFRFGEIELVNEGLKGHRAS